MISILHSRILPAYINQLAKYPKSNPVFMTIDWRCLHYIKSHGGICLFCKKHIMLSLYDLSVCYQREIWVIYSLYQDFKYSFKLGQKIQLSGAKSTSIIRIAKELLSEVYHAKR